MAFDYSDVLVVFDLDGTLVDTAPDLLSALNHVLDEEGLPPVALETARPLMGRGAAALLAHGHETAGRLWQAQNGQRCVERLIAFYQENIAVRSDFFDGAVAAMDMLQAEGASLAICTNKPTYLARQLLTELGSVGRFAAIVGAELGQPRKPDPKHLRKTVQMAGREASRTVMVGDSTVDIEAARGCSVPSIAVRFGYLDKPVEEMGADYILEHYSHLFERIPLLFDEAGSAGA